MIFEYNLDFVIFVFLGVMHLVCYLLPDFPWYIGVDHPLLPIGAPPEEVIVGGSISDFGFESEK